MPQQNLIEHSLLRRLESLSLRSRRPFSSTQVGTRRSLRHGLSIEFADYREYRPGDDLRYLDWKAYGRLNKLFVKLFVDEEDLNVHFLIDSSRSMEFGSPISKWTYAQHAAAAIGFIALHDNCRVDAAAFNTSETGRVNPMRGDQSIPAFLSALEKLPQPSGETDFPAFVRQYAAASSPAGLILVFSDFLHPKIADGLLALAARRHQVALIQVLDREEVSPDYDGDVTLTDSETGQIREVTLSNLELDQYRQQLSSHKAALLQLARKYEMDFLQVVTDEPLEDLIIGSLRTMRIVV